MLATEESVSIWRSLRCVWRALRCVWRALRCVWRALRCVWQALRCVWRALSSICPMIAARMFCHYICSDHFSSCGQCLSRHLTVSLVRRIIRYYTISLLTISHRMGRVMTLSTMFSNNYSLCNTFVKNVVIYFCFLTANNRFVLIEVPLPRQTSQCPSPRTCTAFNGKPCMSRLI